MVVGPSRTRAELLAAELEAQVVTGDLPPGARIGTIEELKKQSGYARSTVGEAIRLLADRGVAEIRPGRGGGVFVQAANPVVRIRHTLLSVREQASSVADAVAVREALEPLIVLDAARHRDAVDIADLRQLVAELESAVAEGTDAFVRANYALHDRIALISPNVTARSIYLAMQRFILDHAEVARHDSEGSDHAWLTLRARVHSDLVSAIVDGDLQRTSVMAARHAGVRASG